MRLGRIAHAKRNRDNPEYVRLAGDDLPYCIGRVRDLWKAALAELPPAATRHLTALRDGLSVASDDAPLFADLVAVEDEALRAAGQMGNGANDPAKGSGKAESKGGEGGGRGSGRRGLGRMPKDESEAKRAALLATIREHSTLKYDYAALAHQVGISKATARRWVNEEDGEYQKSRVAGAKSP